MNDYPLRNARKKAGLTIKQVETQVGIASGNLSRIERGKQVPPPKTIVQLVELYDGAISYQEIMEFFCQVQEENEINRRAA